MANTHSLELEASSFQFASIADASQTGLDFSTTFTAEFWLKLTSLGIYQAIISKDDDTSAALRSYIIIVGNDNKLRILVSDGAGNFDYYRYNTAITVDEWNHWAITCDVGNPSATTFEFFKNGTSVGHGVAEISNNISAIKDSTTSFGLGARQEGEGWNEYSDGKLDDVRLWNDIRTPTEISNNYQKELVGNETGLVGYWKLNNSYLDETSNDNDLTASGSPVFSEDVPFVGAIDHEKELSDTISITETSIRESGKKVVDTSSITEAFAKTVGKPALADACSLTESVANKTTLRVSDAQFITESLATENEFYLSLGDTIAFVDVEAEEVIKALADALAPVESLVKAITLALADEVTFADSEIEELVKSLLDSISIAEEVSILLLKTLYLTDSLSIAEGLTEEINIYLIIRIGDLGFIRSDIP